MASVSTVSTGDPLFSAIPGPADLGAQAGLLDFHPGAGLMFTTLAPVSPLPQPPATTQCKHPHLEPQDTRGETKSFSPLRSANSGAPLAGNTR